MFTEINFCGTVAGGFELKQEKRMKVMRRGGDLNRIQYILSLPDEVREAYKYGELTMEAIRLKISTSPKSHLNRNRNMTRGQFEVVFVRAMERFSIQSPLVKYDKDGNCPVIAMMFDFPDAVGKNTHISFNFRDGEFTFIKLFPARERLIESVAWALEETDFGRRAP